MKRLATIVLLFALHTASATVDLTHLPEQLQKLTELKSAAIHSAAAKLKDLKETAVHNIQHIADDIDLNNLHKLDILQLGPALQKKYSLIKDLYNKPATKVNVVHIYGDDLGSHFEHADHGKLIRHVDHAKLIHHGHHGHHGHNGHHVHHHEHYHDLPEWVLVGAHV